MLSKSLTHCLAKSCPQGHFIYKSIISFPKQTLFIASIHYFLFIMLFSLLLSINELTLFLPNITHIYEVVCVCVSENTTVKLTSLSHLLISLIASLNYNIILKITFVFSLTSLFLKE